MSGIFFIAWLALLVAAALFPTVLSKTVNPATFDTIADGFLRCIFLGFGVAAIYVAVAAPWGPRG